jgi:hypothetical protein
MTSTHAYLTFHFSVTSWLRTLSTGVNGRSLTSSLATNESGKKTTGRFPRQCVQVEKKGKFEGRVCKRDGACGSGPILAKISGAKKAHRTTTLPSPLLRSPAATLPCCCLRATRGRGRESRRPFLSFPPPTLSLLSFSIQDRSQPSHTRRTFHCTQIRSEQEREREREREGALVHD